MHGPVAGPVLVALVSSLAGCRPAPASKSAGEDRARPLAAADLAAIRATDSAFGAAASGGGASAVAELYLPDAQLMPPNAPSVQGREAIERFWGGLLDAYDIRIVLTTDEVEGRGDLGYARGRFTLNGTPKTQAAPPLHEQGKYLEILRRQPDGRWRYGVDMYSSDLPAPAAP